MTQTHYTFVLYTISLLSQYSYNHRSLSPCHVQSTVSFRKPHTHTHTTVEYVHSTVVDRHVHHCYARARINKKRNHSNVGYAALVLLSSASINNRTQHAAVQSQFVLLEYIFFSIFVPHRDVPLFRIIFFRKGAGSRAGAGSGQGLGFSESAFTVL